MGLFYCRALDKEMRAWDTYIGVESTVKNMLTSLRAVGELQNPAIRDRHWQQLMQATGVCTDIVATFLFHFKIDLWWLNSELKYKNNIMAFSLFESKYNLHAIRLKFKWNNYFKTCDDPWNKVWFAYMLSTIWPQASNLLNVHKW